MKKSNLYTCLVIVSMLGSSFRQGPVQDEKAKKILQDSRAKFESLADFTASFNYVLSNPSMKSSAGITKSGIFKYKKGMYFVSLGSQEIYCDLQKQWLYLVDEKEVTISKYDPAESISIESIYKIYETKATPFYLGDETLKGVPYSKISLSSTDASLEYNRVTLWINTKTKLLEKAELIDRKQTKELIEFSNIKTNTGLQVAAFRFDTSKHPGVDVYDDQ